MFKRLILSALTALFLGLSASAENYRVSDTEPTHDYSAEIFEYAGAGELARHLPSAAREYTEGDITYENVSGMAGAGFFARVLSQAAKQAVPASVKLALPVFAVVIIGAVVNVLRGAVSSKPLADALDFVLSVAVAGAVFSGVNASFTAAKGFLEDIHAFMTAMLPVMASLHTVSGSVATAAASSAGLYAVLTVVEAVSTGVLVPVMQICFAFALAGSLSKSENLGGAPRYIRSAAAWIFAALMTFLVAALYFQNILAASADNAAARAVKFSMTSLVPVVGSVLGDASRTIIGSISAVKSVTGVFGIAVIIITLIPPLLAVLFNKLLLGAAEMLASVLGCGSAFIREVMGLFDLLFAVMASVSIVLILTVTVFINTAVAV